MDTVELINILSVIVLVLFGIAVVYLIVLLHRANRMLARIDHLSTSFREFVGQIVPALINIGTVVTAVQAVLHRLVDHKEDSKSKKKGT